MNHALESQSDAQLAKVEILKVDNYPANTHQGCESEAIDHAHVTYNLQFPETTFRYHHALMNDEPIAEGMTQTRSQYVEELRQELKQLEEAFEKRPTQYRARRIQELKKRLGYAP